MSTEVKPNVDPMTIVVAHGHGNAREEYIALRANMDMNTRFVMVCDTTYMDPNHVSNKLRHSFWLPNVELRKGDLFIMWTKKGTSKMSKLSDGRQMYHHYLQLGTPIWNDEKDAAVLMFVRKWTTYPMSNGKVEKRAA